MKRILKILIIFAIFLSIISIVEKLSSEDLKNFIFEKKQSSIILSSLPECPSEYDLRLLGGRNNCFGSFIFYDESENFIGEYIGEWKNSKRHGNGSTTYANGNKYVGEFKDGKFNGQGTFTYLDGRKYVGKWKNSKPHGLGKIIFSNGDISKGKYENGRRNGYGVNTYASGKKTSVYYINGRLVSTICSSIALSGDNNELRKCMYQLISSSKLVNLSNMPNCEITAQDFDNCIFFSYTDKNAFLGKWKNNEMNGDGILFNLESGDSYIGSFRNSSMNGKFIIKSSEGIVRKDFFNKGTSIYTSCLIARTVQISADCSRAERANDNDYVKKYCQRRDFKDFWYKDCVQRNIDEVNVDEALYFINED